MYTDKKNILQLVALLKAHRIQKIVLCPGSRNIPIVQTLVNIPEFTCYPVTDERSAGFFALGLALNGGSPAAICCTSGTASFRPTALPHGSDRWTGRHSLSLVYSEAW